MCLQEGRKQIESGDQEWMRTFQTTSMVYGNAKYLLQNGFLRRNDGNNLGNLIPIAGLVMFVVVVVSLNKLLNKQLSCRLLETLM